MKRLAVLRHAKSSWAEHGVDDHARSLNERGWKAARRIGREMTARRMSFDYMLASTAARVRETLEGVGEEFPFQIEIRFEPDLYLASEDRLLGFLRGLSDSVKAPLFVGHNPGLQQLVLALTRGGQLRDRVADRYPTGALAIIELPIDSWTDLKPGSGQLAGLILPRDLD